MPIYYGGIPLLLEDADGELKDFMRRYQDPADSRFFNLPLDAAALEIQGAFAGVATTRVPLPPRIKLNTLYWPTGTLRWSTCYVLAGAVQTAEILDLIAGKDDGPLTLFLQNGSNGSAIGASMYLLPPRPITSVSSNYGQKIYLLPLVDARYFWNFKQIPIDFVGPVFGQFKTWDSLIEAVSSALGVQIQFTTPPAAGVPFPYTYSQIQSFGNFGRLLGVIAEALGARVVQGLNGVPTIQTWDEAADTLLLDAIFSNQQIAGGFAVTNQNQLPPIKAYTNFPVYNYGSLSRSGEQYQVTSTIESGFPALDGLTINATAPADFSGVTGTDTTDDPSDSSTTATTPNNLSQLQSMADYLAGEKVKEFKYFYDATFQGIFPWVSNAYDDHIEWCAGELLEPQAEDSSGNVTSEAVYRVQTRVQSVVYDDTMRGLYISNWLNNESTGNPYDLFASPAQVRISGSLFAKPLGYYGTTTTASAGHVQAFFVDNAGRTTNTALTLNDRSGTVFANPGDTLKVETDFQTDEWQVTGQLSNAIYKNTGTTTLSAFACIIQAGTTSYTDPDNSSVVSTIKTMTQQGTTLNRLVYLNGGTSVAESALGVYQTQPEQWAKYSTGGSWTPAIGDQCGPQNGSDSVTVGSPGFTVVGETLSDSLGSRVRVRPEDITRVLIKSTEILTQGSFLTNQPIYTGTPGSETNATGMSLSKAYDRFINATTQTGWTIASGAYFWCEWDNNAWYIVQSDTCAVAPGGS